MTEIVTKLDPLKAYLEESSPPRKTDRLTSAIHAFFDGLLDISVVEAELDRLKKSNSVADAEVHHVYGSIKTNYATATNDSVKLLALEKLILDY